ncbi:PHP domain-containing protein [Halocalculus aciditolerans]|uniref:Phosphoesterase n=1 Tax=Halocalculus aciditolerans TaxID=1383812 RepID=A0A830FES0_9EURY|nr:PHP domain-containing protein [Halocalculus aciditolerans]GGL67900.1 phosphoesterase [Halocalculus aciditolerans]
MTGAGHTLYIDTHVHTEGTDESYPSLEAVVERAADVGLDGLVVTDRDTAAAATELLPDLAAEHSLLGIPGVEVSTADGPLLALGAEATPEPGRPIAETARALLDETIVPVVPAVQEREFGGVDLDSLPPGVGLEVYDADTMRGITNTQSARVAGTGDRGAYAGSNARTLADVGQAATSVRLPPGEEPTRQAVLDAMWVGDTNVVARPPSPVTYGKKLLGSAARQVNPFR